MAIPRRKTHSAVLILDLDYILYCDLALQKLILAYVLSLFVSYMDFIFCSVDASVLLNFLLDLKDFFFFKIGLLSLNCFPICTSDDLREVSL